MSNILNKIIQYVTTPMGILISFLIGVIGTGLTIISFFGGEVVPVEVVKTLISKHEAQLTLRNEQLLSQDELNQQLLEIVGVLLQSKQQGDLEADIALNQLQVGQTGRARAYFGKWAKVADNNVQKANGIRYAGMLDYLDNPEAGMSQFREALRLDPQNQALQKVVNSTTGPGSHIFHGVTGGVTINQGSTEEKKP